MSATDKALACPRCGRELVADPDDDTLKCPEMWKSCPGHIADRNGQVLFDPADVDAPLPRNDD
ncbi:MAG: hypothetical protein ABJA82_16055 [Myxococcales bacterium]